MDKTAEIGKALNLWATRIWVFDFDQAKDLREKWLLNLMNRRESDPDKKPSFSNRHGWNSKKEIFHDEDFQSLKIFANAAFSKAFVEMKSLGDFKFRLESWANVHDQGGFNMAHVHRNVLLSGCYYLQVPEKSGPIVFKDPRPGPSLSGFFGAGINSHADFKINPKEGQLIIFPNWLEHFVEINESESQRASIAMNALAVI